MGLAAASGHLRPAGVPIAAHKTEGPSTTLTFLGILNVTQSSTKLVRSLAMVLSWRARQTATKRELQSLICHLSHAMFVVAPGCAILRRMIDLMKVAKLPNHHVRLTADFKLDLQWWASFLPGWNCRSILPDPLQAHTVTSDASGTWGCRAVSDTGRYFQLIWPESWSQVNITVKEMVPVVIAVVIWGNEWEDSTVLARSTWPWYKCWQVARQSTCFFCISSGTCIYLQRDTTLVLEPTT